MNKQPIQHHSGKAYGKQGYNFIKPIYIFITLQIKYKYLCWDVFVVSMYQMQLQVNIKAK